MSSKTTKFCWAFAKAFRLATLVAAAVGVFYLWNWWTGPVHALSSFASDIQVYDDDAAPNGDFGMAIRARCTEEAFHRFARHEKLAAIVTDKLPDGCPGWGSYPVGWWKPPSERGAYCGFENGRTRRLLAYDKGILYYDISRW